MFEVTYTDKDTMHKTVINLHAFRNFCSQIGNVQNCLEVISARYYLPWSHLPEEMRHNAIPGHVNVQSTPTVTDAAYPMYGPPIHAFPAHFNSWNGCNVNDVASSNRSEQLPVPPLYTATLDASRKHQLSLNSQMFMPTQHAASGFAGMGDALRSMNHKDRHHVSVYSKLAKLAPGTNFSSYICTFQGSRDAQASIDNDPSSSEVFVNELLRDEEALELVICDTYGNYAFQKLYHASSPEFQVLIVQKLLCSLPEVSCNLQGSLSVQSMMSSSGLSISAGKLFMNAFEPRCLELMRHDQATYVIQRCLEVFPFAYAAGILYQILVEMESLSGKFLFRYVKSLNNTYYL